MSNQPHPREFWIVAEQVYETENDAKYIKEQYYSESEIVHVIEKSYAEKLKSELASLKLDNNELQAKYNFMVGSARQNAKERDELNAKLEALTRELDEQCRLHGLGANREHKLITEIDELKVKLEAAEKEIDTIRTDAHENIIALEDLGDRLESLQELNSRYRTALEKVKLYSSEELPLTAQQFIDEALASESVYNKVDNDVYNKDESNG